MAAGDDWKGHGGGRTGYSRDRGFSTLPIIILALLLITVAGIVFALNGAFESLPGASVPIGMAR